MAIDRSYSGDAEVGASMAARPSPRLGSLQISLESISSPTAAEAPPRSPNLRTNKLVNVPPFSPTGHKRAAQLEARDVTPSPERSRSQLPGIKVRIGSGSLASRSPASPPWRPLELLPMPPVLAFESWWTEGGQRVVASIEYDTHTHLCTASVQVSVTARVAPCYSSTHMEPWDLHVGAEVRLLGKRITLHKAKDAPTLTWLDQQALLLMHEKKRLEDELGKYRLVTSFPQRPHARCEPLDGRCHVNAPRGGKLNLRALRDDVLALAKALRQHQATLPRLRTTAAATAATPTAASPTAQPSSASSALLSPGSSSAVLLEGPPDWAPERQEMRARLEKEKSLRLMQSMRRPAAPKRDFFEWITSIPLAASAARMQPHEVNKEADGPHHPHGLTPQAAAAAAAVDPAAAAAGHGRQSLVEQAGGGGVEAAQPAAGQRAPRSSVIALNLDVYEQIAANQKGGPTNAATTAGAGAGSAGPASSNALQLPPGGAAAAGQPLSARSSNAVVAPSAQPDAAGSAAADAAGSAALPPALVATDAEGAGTGAPAAEGAAAGAGEGAAAAASDEAPAPAVPTAAAAVDEAEVGQPVELAAASAASDEQGAAAAEPAVAAASPRSASGADEAAGAGASSSGVAADGDAGDAAAAAPAAAASSATEEEEAAPDAPPEQAAEAGGSGGDYQEDSYDADQPEAGQQEEAGVEADEQQEQQQQQQELEQEPQQQEQEPAAAAEPSAASAEDDAAGAAAESSEAGGAAASGPPGAAAAAAGGSGDLDGVGAGEGSGAAGGDSYEDEFEADEADA